MSKEQAVIDFLLTNDNIKDTPLYFNFINPKDDNKQIITLANDKAKHKPYIDGTVEKQFTFTIVDFQSISYNAIAKMAGHPDENVGNYIDFQGIIDWIEEQNELRNFPDFGEDCIIDSMDTLTDNPNLGGVDTNVTPTLAKYSVSIRIQYLDKSKQLWTR